MIGNDNIIICLNKQFKYNCNCRYDILKFQNSFGPVFSDPGIS